MFRQLFYLSFFISLFFSGNVLLCQGLNNPGGRGMLHLHSAWVLEKGAITLQLDNTSFYKTVLVNSANQGPIGQTFYDVVGNVGVNYASSRHIEWSIAQNLYQDTFMGNRGFTFPTDINFRFKFGSFGGVRNHFRLGLLANALLPLNDKFNLPLQPYSSGTFELGFIGIVSYSSNLIIPESGFNLHLNLGLWQYSDSDKSFTSLDPDPFTVNQSTRAFIYGLGFVIPTNRLDFGLEVHGKFFAVQPPITVYGREDYAYITPSLTYRTSNRVSLNVGFDIRLSEDIDDTQYSSNTTVTQIHPDLSNYPSWRLHLGTQIYLTKRSPQRIKKPAFADESIEQIDPEYAGETPETLQEKLVQERRKIEMAEEKLEMVRFSRRDMESSIQILRNILEFGTPKEPEITQESDSTQITKQTPSNPKSTANKDISDKSGQ